MRLAHGTLIWEACPHARPGTIIFRLQIKHHPSLPASPTLPFQHSPPHLPQKTTILWGLPPWQFKHGRGLWSYSTYHGARYHSQIPSAHMGLLVSKTTLVRPQQTVLSTCNACPTMAPGYHDRQLESTRQCLSLPHSSHQCSPHSSGSIHGHQAHLSTICDCTQIQQKCCRTMEPCPSSPVGKSTSYTASFDLIPVQSLPGPHQCPASSDPLPEGHWPCDGSP